MEELTEEQELIFDLFDQTCAVEDEKTGKFMYDHYCMSCYEQAQDYLVKEGIIDVKDCVRP